MGHRETIIEIAPVADGFGKCGLCSLAKMPFDSIAADEKHQAKIWHQIEDALAPDWCALTSRRQIATFGIVLAAWYLLTMVRRTLFGPLNPSNSGLTDMTTREIVVMVPIVILFFVIGLFPNLFFEKINPPVEATTSQAAIATTILEMGE